MRRNNRFRVQDTSNIRPLMSCDPLMTGHSELQDLDNELQLLKRKRELIELQHQNLITEQRMQHNYDFQQPQQTYQQSIFEPNQNYSQYYDDQPIPHSSGYLGKRPSDSYRWSSNTLSGPQGAKRKFSPNVETLSAKERLGPPIKQTIEPWNQTPAFLNTMSVPPSQRFKPDLPKQPKKKNPFFKLPQFKIPNNRVNKNQLKWQVQNAVSNAQPIQSKPIQAKATPAKVPKRSAKQAASPQNKLLPDVVPTQQVAGRLEIALGNILKEIKDTFIADEAYGSLFDHTDSLRRMKLALRERLRAVMLNKHVGSWSTIIQEYRKIFPKNTDIEILQVAKATINGSMDRSLIYDESASPLSYFKANMKSLVETSLNDIFVEMFEISVRNMPGRKQDPTGDIKKNFNEHFNKKPLKGKKNNKDKKVIPVAIETDSKEIESKEIENMDIDNKETKDQETTEMPKVEKEQEENGAELKLKQNENINTSTLNTTDDKSEDDVILGDDNFVKINLRRKRNSKINLDKSIRTALVRHLPTILPKFKKEIIQLLELDSKFVEAKEAIYARVREKLTIAAHVDLTRELKIDNTVIKVEKSAEKTTATTPAVNTAAPAVHAPETLIVSGPPFFLKVVGFPSLPRKKIMQAFLNQFNPRSIKKHKSMQLLFVEFDKKYYFDKLLAANGMKLEKSTLSVKVSNARKPQPPNNDSVVSQGSNEQAQGVADLSSDLDSQIDDLLLSIRAEEEICKKPNEPPTTSNEEETTIDLASDDKDNINSDSEVEIVTENKETIDISDELTITVEDVKITESIAVSDDVSSEPVMVDDAEVEKREENDTLEINEKQEENDNEKQEENDDEKQEENDNEKQEENDKVEVLPSEIKENTVATPVRASSRLAANATPSSIRTRRTSKMAP